MRLLVSLKRRTRCGVCQCFRGADSTLSTRAGNCKYHNDIFPIIMPHGLTSAKHVSGAMDSALQYVGVAASEIEDLCSSIKRTIEILDGWHSRACQPDQPTDCDSCNTAPTAALQLRLPEFLQKSLQSIDIGFDCQVRLKTQDANGDRLAHELSKDLALLRHVVNFVQDIARSVASDGQAYSPGGSLELFPDCDTENDQAFWQSHQDQVCVAI